MSYFKFQSPQYKIFGKNQSKMRLYLSYLAAGAVTIAILILVTLFYSSNKVKDTEVKEGALMSNELGAEKDSAENQARIYDSTTSKNSNATVTVIVANLGLNARLLEAVYELPKEVFLGFSPYAPHVTSAISEARSKGYQVLINIPVQPKNYPEENRGPYCLLSGLSRHENESRLHWILSISNQIHGVYVDPKEIFTESQDNVKMMLSTLNQQKLDSNRTAFFYEESEFVTTVDHYLKEFKQTRVLARPVHFVIESGELEYVIRDKLLRIENAAKEKGSVVVMLYPDYKSVKILIAWLKHLHESNLSITQFGSAKE